MSKQQQQQQLNSYYSFAAKCFKIVVSWDSPMGTLWDLFQSDRSMQFSHKLVYVAANPCVTRNMSPILSLQCLTYIGIHLTFSAAYLFIKVLCAGTVKVYQFLLSTIVLMFMQSAHSIIGTFSLLALCSKAYKRLQLV